MDKKIIILDTANFTWAHRYRRHRIEFASEAEVAEFLHLRTLWTRKIIILDTRNSTRSHIDRKDRIEFASEAEVGEFLYGEDIMD